MPQQSRRGHDQARARTRLAPERVLSGRLPRSGVQIRILGCGDAFGTGGRLHTSFLLDAPGTRILIDCGASTLIALHRYQINPATIDAVVLSHLHGDHFGGLPFLLLDAAFVTRRKRPLIVAGPAGSEDRIRTACDTLFPDFWSAHGPRLLRWVEHAEARPQVVAGVTVTPFEVIHNSGARPYALRLEANGCTVAFSGDTAWTEALLTVADGSDLFLCESTSFARQIPDHLTYRTVEARRGDFRTSRLVLTHLGPDMLARAARLAIECAQDGQLIKVKAGAGRSSKPGRVAAG